MLEAMFGATVGDDVFGEDPEVNRLEAFGAELLGGEAALFCPSGTMTNQIAIQVHLPRMAEVIVEKNSHTYLYEAGGIGVNAGGSVSLLEGNRGRLTAEQVENAIRPDDVHFPKTALVSLENTCNRGGGACYDFEEFKRIRETCDKHQLKLHLDGARLFNAIIAQKDNPSAYGKIFDSISVCLSKGLGAPVGSLLIGSKEFIRQARRVRKVMGGGMRQAGYLAAAGYYALHNHIERLDQDHAMAKDLGATVEQLPYVETLHPVDTNILVFGLRPEVSPDYFLNWLTEQNIKAVSFGGNLIRFVTHLDIKDEMINRVKEVLTKFPS